MSKSDDTLEVESSDFLTSIFTTEAATCSAMSAIVLLLKVIGGFLSPPSLILPRAISAAERLWLKGAVELCLGDATSTMSLSFFVFEVLIESMA
jgi:hypothetical protein